MSMMKRGLSVMEDILHDGPATRKQLWERNPVCSWEMFKRLIGMLTVEGLVKRELASPDRTDPAKDQWVLTKEGEEVVQSFAD